MSAVENDTTQTEKVQDPEQLREMARELFRKAKQIEMGRLGRDRAIVISKLSGQIFHYEGEDHLRSGLADGIFRLATEQEMQALMVIPELARWKGVQA